MKGTSRITKAQKTLSLAFSGSCPPGDPPSPPSVFCPAGRQPLSHTALSCHRCASPSPASEGRGSSSRAFTSPWNDQ